MLQYACKVTCSTCAAVPPALQMAMSVAVRLFFATRLTDDSVLSLAPATTTEVSLPEEEEAPSAADGAAAAAGQVLPELQVRCQRGWAGPQCIAVAHVQARKGACVMPSSVKTNGSTLTVELRLPALSGRLQAVVPTGARPMLPAACWAPSALPHHHSRAGASLRLTMLCPPAGGGVWLSGGPQRGPCRGGGGGC